MGVAAEGKGTGPAGYFIQSATGKGVLASSAVNLGGDFDGGAGGLQGTASAGNTIGVQGYGHGTGSGIYGLGGSGGIGVYGDGNGNVGVYGQGATAGVYGKGTSGALGGLFEGGSGNSTGVSAVGTGTGKGLLASAPGSGAGVSSSSSTGRAFESTSGGVGIPSASKFEFTATKTGVIILSASDFLHYSSTGTFASNTPLFKNADFEGMNHWVAGSTTSSFFCKSVHLPRGARITNIEVWLKDDGGGGVALFDPAVYQMKYDASTGSGVVRTAILDGTGAIATVAPNGYGWYATSAVTTGASTDATSGRTGNGNSSWVEFGWAPGSIASDYYFGGFRITYTYTDVDFMT
jgi:hypothetical protein